MKSIAQPIIVLAKAGERDPERLCDGVLQGISRCSAVCREDPGGPLGGRADFTLRAGPLQTLTSSRPWGGAFSFLVRLAPSPLEPNNPSQINWRRPGRSTVLDRAALAAQVRPTGGARSKPRLASVRALTHPHAPSWLAGCRPNNAGRAAKEPGWAFFAQIPHIEPLHFGIRSDGIGHRLRFSLARGGTTPLLEMRMFDFSSPELRVLANSILRCSGSNPAAPASQSVSNAYGIGSRSKCRRLGPRTCFMP